MERGTWQAGVQGVAKSQMQLSHWAHMHAQRKNIASDKMTYYITIEVSVSRGNIMILSMYTPNNRASKHVKHKLRNGKKNGQIMITV